MVFFLMIPPPPRSTLFPYTTLFRSQSADDRDRPVARHVQVQVDRCRGNEQSGAPDPEPGGYGLVRDRKSTRLNSSHPSISYAVFCLKKKNNKTRIQLDTVHQYIESD